MPPICGHRHVRLVDDQQEVVGEVVEQAVRRGARLPAVGVPGVVLDARAGADLAHHLDVVGGAHAQPLRLEQLVLPLQLGQPVGELGLDAGDRALHPLGGRDVVSGGADVDLGLLAEHLAGERVHGHQPLDLVAEELHPHGELLVDGEHLEGVATYPERAAGAGQVVAGVLHLDQLAQQAVAVELVAHLHVDHPVEVLVGRAETVDARDGRHHDHVAPGEQGPGGRVPQPLDLVVDRRVLLDVGVRLRDVRLRLVVVVVGHEVLDRVVREELPQLVGVLRGQRLVRLHHQDRALHLLGQPGHRRGLAGAGRTQQHDVLLARVDPLDQLLDGLRLVAGRREVADHLERGDGALQVLAPISWRRAYGGRRHSQPRPTPPPPGPGGGPSGLTGGHDGAA